MSKRFQRNDHYDDYDNDHHENGYHDHMKEHRRLKRMKNALKSKNINDLIHLDEDEDDYYD